MAKKKIGNSRREKAAEKGKEKATTPPIDDTSAAPSTVGSPTPTARGHAFGPPAGTPTLRHKTSWADIAGGPDKPTPSAGFHDRFQVAPLNGVSNVYIVASTNNDETVIFSTPDVLSEIWQIADPAHKRSRIQRLIDSLEGQAEDIGFAIYKLSRMLDGTGLEMGEKSKTLGAAAQKTEREKQSHLTKIKGIYHQLYFLLVDPTGTFRQVEEKTVEGINVTSLPGKDLLKSALAFAEAASKKGLTFSAAMQYVAVALFDRISASVRGGRRTMYLMKADFDKACETVEAGGQASLPAKDRWEKVGKELHHEVAYSTRYWLPYNKSTEAGKRYAAEGDKDKETWPRNQPATPAAAIPRVNTNRPSRTPSVSSSQGGGPLQAGDINELTKRFEQQQMETPIAKRLRSGHLLGTPAVNKKGEYLTSSPLAVLSPAASELSVLSEGALMELMHASKNPDLEFLNERVREREAAEKTEKELAEMRRTGRKCGCDDWSLKQFSSFWASTVKPLPQNERILLVNKLKPLMAKERNDGKMRSLVCFHHAGTTMRCLGLIKSEKGLRHDTMFYRLRTICDQKNFSSLVTNPRFSAWFLMEERPASTRSMLGTYNYRFKDNSAANDAFTDPMVTNMKGLVQVLLGRDSSMWAAYKRDGTINLPIFQWLDKQEDSIRPKQTRKYYLGTAQDVENDHTKTLSILSLMKCEFELYHYHERHHGLTRTSKKGWLRNMYHSLTQQLFRMDVVYWIIYVILRPDHCHRLISYPYYAGRKDRGDMTGFRHIDLNVRKLAEYGKGANQLQGSVSLDAEDRHACTIVLKTMHEAGKLTTWLAMLDKRGVGMADGRVTGIQKKHWTDEEKRVFKVDWETVPCKFGEARFSDPAIPHGSTDRNKNMKLRRTVLPWFVKVENDDSLEIPEAGTFQNLADAHRDKEAGPLTPSGLAVKYGKIPYRFPAVQEMSAENPVSKALVGRLRWDNPEVSQWINTFCAPGATQAKTLAEIRATRLYAAEQYRIKFWNLLRLEQQMFEDESIVRRALNSDKSNDWLNKDLPTDLEARFKKAFLSRPKPSDVNKDDAEWTEGHAGPEVEEGGEYGDYDE